MPSRDYYSAEELRQARPPIASLLSKSEKAQQKLAPESWQYAMLRDNIKALRIATALMSEEPTDAARFSGDDLREALTALASMASRTEGAFVKFAPGTSQHTLQANRLEALQVAQAFVRAALDED